MIDAIDGGEEAGSVLIFALVFLIAVSMIVIALAGWTGNDLRNTVNFEADRAVTYGAAGAAEVAIWNARYSAPTSASIGVCPGATHNSSTAQQAITVSGQAIAVWCQTSSPSIALPPPNNFDNRIVTLWACPDSETRLTCTGSPLVKAVVYFDDYSNSTGSTPGTMECTSGDESTCGTGMTVNSWVVK